MSYQTPPSRDQHAAMKRVQAIKDSIAECKRRWPDFAFSVGFETDSGGNSYREVKATWFRDGHQRGLRDLLPVNASATEINDSKELISRHALYLAELGCA